MKNNNLRKRCSSISALVLALALLINCLPFMQQNARAATPTFSISGGSANAASSGSISLNFGTAMSTTSSSPNFTLNPATGSIAFTGTWDSSEQIYSVNYSGLSINTLYTLTCSGFLDASSAPVPSAAFTFTTLTDITPPIISSVTPSNGSAHAPSAGPIIITFNEAMDPSTGLVKLNGNSLPSGTWSLGNTVYTIAYSGINPGTACSLELSAFKDLAGNFISPNPNQSYGFNIANSGAPSVVSLSPMGSGAPLNGNIVIGFSKIMDNASIGTITLNGSTLSGGSWNNAKTQFSLPYVNLSANTSYSIAISGFKDASGQLMNNFTPISFTTTSASSSSYSYNQLPSANNGYTAVSSTAFNKFKGVSIDGYTLINGVDYVAREGSTIVTLSANIINRLAVGTHKLVLHFSDGTAVSNFSVTTGGIGSGTAYPGYPGYPTYPQTPQANTTVQALVDQKIDAATLEESIR